MQEDKNEIITCSTCIHRHEQKTPQSSCYPKENEFQFSFCNYQQDKEIIKKVSSLNELY